MGKSKRKNKEEDLPKNIWMVRSCYLYDEEFDDCKSIRGRFQQYFVDGKMEDCNSWMHDYNNCRKYKDTKDKAALEAIIANEEIRRYKRLNPHFNNPVWEDRTEPPPDWNAPLPPFLEEKQKNTFLAMKAQELREGKDLKAESFCSIM